MLAQVSVARESAGADLAAKRLPLVDLHVFDKAFRGRERTVGLALHSGYLSPTSFFAI